MKVNNVFKTAAFLLLMSGTMALNAQKSGSDEFKGIAKGNGLIGILPGASFNDDGNGTSNFRISNTLTGGYFIKDNLMLGLSLGQTYSQQKVNANTSTNLTMNNGICLRYYKFFTNRFGFFLNNSVGMSYFSNSSINGVGGYIDVSPNFVYKAGKCLMLEAGVGGLNATYMHNSQGNNTMNANFTFINNFRFGVSWKLGNK